jgi:4'-phosphopantetheinyl transferase
MNHDAAGGDFTRAVEHALACSGFAPPDVGEARVLLLENSVWSVHAGAAEQWLDAGERSRAARFRFEHDRVAYILAHAFWRATLAACLDVDAAHVQLVRTRSGQPRLPGMDLATSLSRSDQWTAIVVCRAVTVGIDIERSPSRIAMHDLIATICTPAEAADVMVLPVLERDSALLALWTRKEALLKAFGVGLAVPPSTLPVSTAEVVMPPKGVVERPPCRVRDLDLPAGLIGALAAPETVKGYGLHLLVEPTAPCA